MLEENKNIYINILYTQEMAKDYLRKIKIRFDNILFTNEDHIDKENSI
jgi:hypothetical protein